MRQAIGVLLSLRALYAEGSTLARFKVLVHTADGKIVYEMMTNGELADNWAPLAEAARTVVRCRSRARANAPRPIQTARAAREARDARDANQSRQFSCSRARARREPISPPSVSALAQTTQLQERFFNNDLYKDEAWHMLAIQHILNPYRSLGSLLQTPEEHDAAWAFFESEMHDAATRLKANGQPPYEPDGGGGAVGGGGAAGKRPARDDGARADDEEHPMFGASQEVVGMSPARGTGPPEEEAPDVCMYVLTS